jgi:two-component system chemotaxis sensor kinase CheA
VIKSLEQNYQKVDSISGATILGDGTVALIVDISGVINSSSDKKSDEQTQAA